MKQSVIILGKDTDNDRNRKHFKDFQSNENIFYPLTLFERCQEIVVSFHYFQSLGSGVFSIQLQALNGHVSLSFCLNSISPTGYVTFPSSCLNTLPCQSYLLNDLQFICLLPPTIFVTSSSSSKKEQSLLQFKFTFSTRSYTIILIFNL